MAIEIMIQRPTLAKQNPVDHTLCFLYSFMYLFYILKLVSPIYRAPIANEKGGLGFGVILF